MSAIIEQLNEGCATLGVRLSEEQSRSIERYLELLQAYNEHTNLVAKGQPELVLREHVLDALTLVPILSGLGGGTGHLVDVGTGAGFPGMVLAIAIADLQVTLVDSIGKKTRFLSETVAALGLQPRVQVFTSRAEELAHQKEFRDKFMFATGRAVAKLDLLYELTLPLLRVGGFLLAQKSRHQSGDEIPAAAKALALLGGSVKSIEAPNMEATGKDAVVIVVEKIKPTPGRYPRPTAQLKRPLQ